MAGNLSILVTLISIWVILGQVDSRAFQPYVDSMIIENLNLIDGDMLFKNDQKEESLQRQRRSVLTSKQFSWENGIVPYEFDTVHPVSEKIRTLAENSFKHIMEHTCIKFVKRTTEDQYLNVTSQINSSCHSFVGRVLSGSQELNLGAACDQLYVIVHEILHALGFLHEHSRTDRDQFVVVNFTNVNPGITNALRQFDIYAGGRSGPASNQSLPYDLHSVLHYSRFTFSKFYPNGRIPQNEFNDQDRMTIYAKQDSKIQLGNRKGLSKLDIQRVNLHYNCPPMTTTQTTSKQTTTTETTTTQANIANVTTTKKTTITTTAASTISNDSTSSTVSQTETTEPAATKTKSTTTTKETTIGATSTTKLPETTKKTSSKTTLQPNATIVVVIGDDTVIVNKFGIPDSSNVLSFSFCNLFIMALIAVALQNIMT